MFQAKGCICDACKEAFRKHAKLTAARVDKIWPDAILDRKSKAFHAFSSHQYGQVVRKLQEGVTRAGKEMGLKYAPSYNLSISPKYYDPKHWEQKIHHPKEYLGHISKLLIWKYHNTVNPMGVDLSLMVGNNLPILRDFDNTMALVRRYGRKENGRQLPEVMFLPTELYDGHLLMPRDYYFTSLLTFFYGMQGYGTWTRDYKQDARYLALHARANETISRFEDVVMNGAAPKRHSVRVASPVPKRAGKTVTVVDSREFSHGGRRYIAMGNDYFRPTYVRLRIQDATASVVLKDEINRTFYAATATAGHKPGGSILIRLLPKEWHVFELTAGPTPGYAPMTADKVRMMLKQELKDLKRWAKEAE